MAEERVQRRLAAILAADGGRIVKTTGDGILAEFPSAVDAVRNAVAIQAAMPGRDADLPEDRRIVFRVGINVGDVIVEGDDIFGDGVNVAARLEGLAEPGGICLSRPVFDQVKKQLDVGYEYLGKQEVKNIAEPVYAYCVLLEPASAGTIIDEAGASKRPSAPLPLPDIPSIAVLPFSNIGGDPEQEYFSDV